MIPKAKPAIYKIENIQTHEIYLGATKNAQNRKRGHFYDLRNRRHRNPKLQADFDASGGDLNSFDFVVLEYLDDSLSDTEILNREQAWMDFLHPAYNSRNALPKYGSDYELERERKLAGKSTYVESPEAKERRMNSVREYWKTHTKVLTEEHKKIISERMKGENHPQYGKTVPEERRKRIAAGVSKVEYKLLSPTGEEVVAVNLKQFCKDNDLSEPRMYELARGLLKSVKGWRLISKTRLDGEYFNRDAYAKKTFVGFVSPDGVEFREIKNLMVFCEDHNLDYQCMRKLDSKRLKSYKGWTKIRQ